MDKAKLHHYWRYMRRLSVWWLVAALAASVVISSFALRNNNLTMLRLRDEVYEADKNNQDLEGALRRLREYVYGHMNTRLVADDSSIRPPIQLKYSYERAVQAEKARVSAVNERVYTEAQAECERRFPVGLSGSGRVPCIEEYVTAHGAKERSIPPDVYTYDFVSPTWTPDFAGFSVLVSGLLAVLTALWALLSWWVRGQFKKHL